MGKEMLLTNKIEEMADQAKAEGRLIELSPAEIIELNDYLTKQMEEYERERVMKEWQSIQDTEKIILTGDTTSY